MTPQQPGSVRAAGRLTIVFIGADAGSAPAESVRALAGADAVFVPAGLADGLRRLLEDASAVARLIDLDPDVPAPALEAARHEGALVAAAGPDAQRLVRRLRDAAAEHGDIEVSTVPPQPLFDDCVTAQALVSLLHVTRILRQRCPWDRVQTAGDIVSYSLEEVYELADAIAAGDVAEEHGELGDVLFQVYFLAVLLEEQTAGDLGSVAEAIERKLVRRHTHIFAGAVAETPAAVRDQWERIKREQEGRQGIFHDVPASLPALIYARKLQRRAAEVGFDWDTAHEAFPKITEEHGELRAALEMHGPLPGSDDPQGSPVDPAGRSSGERRPVPAVEMRHDPHLRHEVGDLLFAVVNVARKAGVDPELALRQAAQRFERRVVAAADLAATEGRDWAALGLDEQERYYQRAKRETG